MKDEIKEWWKNFFHKLYNKNPIRGVVLADIYLPRDTLYCRRVTESEVKKALKKNENTKVGGPDYILI